MYVRACVCNTIRCEFFFLRPFPFPCVHLTTEKGYSTKKTYTPRRTDAHAPPKKENSTRQTARSQKASQVGTWAAAAILWAAAADAARVPLKVYFGPQTREETLLAERPFIAGWGGWDAEAWEPEVN